MERFLIKLLVNFFGDCNLAEWMWADKFDKHLIFNFLSNSYLRITSPHIIGALVFLYVLIVMFTSVLTPEILINSLQGILGFWIIIGVAILFREFIIKRSRVAYL